MAVISVLGIWGHLEAISKGKCSVPVCFKGKLTMQYLHNDQTKGLYWVPWIYTLIVNGLLIGLANTCIHWSLMVYW